MTHTTPTIVVALISATVGAALTAALTLTGSATAHDPTPGQPTRICARAAFTADDYAHTGTGARAEHRAVAACAAQVGGF